MVRRQMTFLDEGGSMVKVPAMTQVSGTIKEKVKFLLANEAYQEALEKDNALILLYWYVFDGLSDMISEEQFEKILAWAMTDRSTNAESIRRRRQQVQRLRTGEGSLLPDSKIQEKRRELDRSGWRREYGGY